MLHFSVTYHRGQKISEQCSHHEEGRPYMDEILLFDFIYKKGGSSFYWC